jgi:hypothetical protein
MYCGYAVVSSIGIYVNLFVMEFSDRPHSIECNFQIGIPGPTGDANCYGTGVTNTHAQPHSGS